MKGIICAGGQGTRLRPLTYISNKHLLGVYNKPMIEYSIETLKKLGIKDILIVTGKEHSGHFSNYLGNGSDRGLHFTYEVQTEAGGIAQAVGMAENFMKGEESFAVILGDNIFEDNFLDDIQVESDCVLFYKKVDDPRRFGVLEVDRIIEKPKETKSNMAITGFYIYDYDAFRIIKTLKPSDRGEIEITDLNNWYLKNKRTVLVEVNGYWSDCGTPDSLLNSSNWAKQRNEKDN